MNGPLTPDGCGGATLALLVDALVWPLMLLHPDGRLLHANAAALQALASRRLLVLGPQQDLWPAEPQRHAAWQAALAAARGGQRRLLHWPGPEACTATVAPLAGGPDDAPALLVALGMASHCSRASPETAPRDDADTSAYAKAHGLTRAEARVLQRLALGDSPAVAARALGVAVATVRSQAAAIRRKTGHDSTAALVGAAARNSPIWPESPPTP